MAEEEAIIVGAVREGDGTKKMCFASGHEASSFLRLGKKRSRLKFLIRQKNCSFGDTSVSETTLFDGPKRFEVFNTSQFLETEVF
jgi:hypothetical protein